MEEKRKISVRHYKFEIILLFFIVVITLIHKLFIVRMDYIAGLYGNPFYTLMILPLILILLGLFLLLLIIALVNLIRIFVQAVKLKKVNWLKVLLCLVPFLICFILFISRKPGAVYFLKGYEKWVQKEVDIASIQKWLKSLPPYYSETYYFEAKDFPEELPEAITKLKPYHMYFGKFEKENRSVEFEWGSALGHWGIKIGLPGMETPNEEYVKLKDSSPEFRRPIQSGVYIFERE